MNKESMEQIRAFRVILMVLDDLVQAGGEPGYEGDESSTNPDAFKKLVMQYAGDRISESAIDNALQVPLQDIAETILKLQSQK